MEYRDLNNAELIVVLNLLLTFGELMMNEHFSLFMHSEAICICSGLHSSNFIFLVNKKLVALTNEFIIFKLLSSPSLMLSIDI